jgi:hypothetical protein
MMLGSEIRYGSASTGRISHGKHGTELQGKFDAVSGRSEHSGQLAARSKKESNFGVQATKQSSPVIGPDRQSRTQRTGPLIGCLGSLRPRLSHEQVSATVVLQRGVW